MTWDIPAMIKSGVDLIDKFVPDTDAKNRAKEAWQLRVLEIAAQEASQQSTTNTEEAKHASLFVSGWRPAVGWVCAFSFMWICFGQPLFSWVYVLVTKQPAPVIDLPTEMLMTTLLGMLGLGTLRTLEKIKGVSAK
jgi:hypothetical protein